MSVVLNKIHDGIQFLSQYPKIGRFFGTILGLIEVPILDFIYFLDKYITPGSYQKSMKMFSLFYGSKIIPLSVKIEGTPTVAPTEEIMGIIKRMPAVSIGYCYCRVKEKNCDNPIWTCIHIGTAKHLDELGRKISLKSSTIDEVEQLLLKSDKLGLVHQLLTAPNPNYVYVICNCCPCCCVMLRNAIDFNFHGSAMPSNFIITHNSDKCSNCGKCIKRCYFGSLTMKKDTLIVNEEKCTGCGLCVNSCENDVLSLIQRIDVNKI